MTKGQPSPSKYGVSAWLNVACYLTSELGWAKHCFGIQQIYFNPETTLHTVEVCPDFMFECEHPSCSSILTIVLLIDPLGKFTFKRIGPLTSYGSFTQRENKLKRDSLKFPHNEVYLANVRPPFYILILLPMSTSPTRTTFLMTSLRPSKQETMEYASLRATPRMKLKSPGLFLRYGPGRLVHDSSTYCTS
jgi:hypothetical protein